MIWGIKDNQRVRATPKDKAICELCQQELIAKCGEIKIWHWAHKSKIECDSWWEPESEWHIKWKNEFPKECQEITIKKCVSDYCNNKKYNHNHADEYNHGNCVDCVWVKHRADIKTRTGTIIELQSSPISLKDIKEREEFYGNKLIWLLNGDTFGKNLWFHKKFFAWKWMPTIISHSKNTIFIDLNIGGIAKLQSVYKTKNKYKQNGTGILYSRQQFLQLYGDIFKSDFIENGIQVTLNEVKNGEKTI